jgi:hypothetical protein
MDETKSAAINKSKVDGSGQLQEPEENLVDGTLTAG